MLVAFTQSRGTACFSLAAVQSLGDCICAILLLPYSRWGTIYLCFLCFIQSLGKCVYAFLLRAITLVLHCGIGWSNSHWRHYRCTLVLLAYCPPGQFSAIRLTLLLFSIVGWAFVVETCIACPLLSLPQVPCWRIDASVRGTFGDLPVHMPGPFPSLGYKFFAACVYLLPHQYISQLTFLLLYVSRASKPGLRHDYVLRVITYNVC